MERSVAEWLRRVALVCITTEGSAVRIASAVNFFAFLFSSCFLLQIFLCVVSNYGSADSWSSKCEWREMKVHGAKMNGY